MPRLKPTARELNNRSTQAVFDYTISKYGLGYDTIAKHFCCTSRTVHNKRNHPETLTLGEIRAFIQLGKLTDEQIIEFLGVRAK